MDEEELQEIADLGWTGYAKLVARQEAMERANQTRGEVNGDG